MFGSQILEVGIGLILVFLMVSLFLTSIRETIEGFFKTRAVDLEHALAELLDDHSGTGARKAMFAHPLVSALFPGMPRPTSFSNGKVVKRFARNMPSYIPRETFAVVLEDLLSKGAASDKVVTAYNAILSAAGGDPARARRGIEQWYDSAMDRAAGWYRRRTHRILLISGLLIAIVLNVNAITIAQHLSSDQESLQRLVGAAQVLSNDPAAQQALAPPQQQRTAAQPAPRAAPAEAPSDFGANEGAGEDAGAQEDAGSADVSEADAATEAPADAAPAAPAPAAKAEDQVIRDELQRQLRAAGLPIGWTAEAAEQTWQQLTGHGFWSGLLFGLTLLCGWLMVAFAGTLGAPFWFDLLGKFMVVRSTVKPREKSRDEASKDGGTGGAPVTPPAAPAPSVG